MRVHFLLALVVATYAATCNSVVNADNVAKLNDVEADGAQFIGGDNQIRRFHGARELTASKDWWVSNENEEERGFPGASLFSKLKGKADKVSNLKGGAGKYEKLNNAQVKEVTVATANAVKKDRKIWPHVKKFLKILYGATVTALIIVGVEAMLK